MLLLPGFDGTGLLFEPLIQALGSAFSCHALAYDDHTEIDDYVQQAAERLDDLTQPCVVVAESFSGPVALRLAKRSPEKISALILSTTFNRPPLQGLARLAAVPAGVTGSPEFLRKILVRYFCLNGIEDPQLLRECVSVSEGRSAETVRSRLLALAATPPMLNLTQWSVKTLIIGAVHDRVVSGGYVRSLAHALPDAELTWVDGPHLLLQAKAVECAELIRDFCR